METIIEEKEIGRFKLAFSIFLSNKSAVAGFIIFLAYVLDAIIVQFTPWIFGINDPNTLQFDFVNTIPQPPSSQHILGTTYGGVDLFIAIIQAIRIDLGYSALIVLIGATIGLFIGIIAGYFGGWFDEFLMRITDIFFGIPYLVLALAVGFALGRNITSMVIALVIIWWPLYARYARSLTLSIKETTFVEAARAAGVSPFGIMFKHIMPNTLPPILVQMSLDLGVIMAIFATLTFIGFLPGGNLPELGYLTSLGLNYIRVAPWAVIFPGMAITIFALAVNLMGDGLRDVIDPRRRS
jgi:peptide/nickel transport system permease protein